MSFVISSVVGSGHCVTEDYNITQVSTAVLTISTCGPDWCGEDIFLLAGYVVSVLFIRVLSPVVRRAS